MKKLILALMAAAIFAGTAIEAFAAPTAPTAAQTETMDHGFLLDARLAGMRAALKLNAEQDKLWPVFEAAVREGDRARAQAMRDLHEDVGGPERPSPVALMTEMSEALAADADAMKRVAEAARPLYDSLDAQQKAYFGPLLHMLRESGPRAL